MRTVPLGEICEFKYGASLPERRREPGPVPVYGSNGMVGTHAKPLTDGEAIIVGRKGSIGEINYSPVACWPIDTTYYLDRTATKHDLRWLSYALSNLELDQLNKATGVPGLNRNDAYAKPIFVPPLAQQRRIAAILDQADALRQRRREAVEQLGRLEAAVFNAMFGAPERNPHGLTVTELGRLIAEGPTNGLYKPASAYGAGVPILRINNFYDGRVIELGDLRRLTVTDAERRTYALEADDIVVNRVNSREFVGKSAIVPALSEPTVFESNMMRVRLDRSRIEPGYAIAFLQTDFIKRQIANGTKDAVNQSSINQSDVRSFKIMLPPLSDQQRFVKQVGVARTVEKAHRTHLAQLDALFASLQHRAFSGELGREGDLEAVRLIAVAG